MTGLAKFTFGGLLTTVLVCAIALISHQSLARLHGTGIAPASILSVTATPPTGTLTAAIDSTVSFSVCYGLAVTVSGGPPTLPVNTSPVSTVATYASGSGGKCHTYNYTVTTNAFANPVATTSAGIVPNGAIFLDANGHAPNQNGAVNISFPNLALSPGSVSGAPSIASITSSCAGNVTVAGTNCVLFVNFSTAVFVGGPSQNIELLLGTAPVGPARAYLCDDTDAIRTLPAYAQSCGGVGSGSGTATLNFGVKVLGGEAANPVQTTAAAINLIGGTTIQSAANVNATLTGANSMVIPGVTFSPGNAYCVAASGGNDSSSGICGVASFATLTKAQTAMRGGAVKTTFLQAGTYTGLGTCPFTTNTGFAANGYICQTSADNGAIWSNFPGQNANIDGGCPASSGNTPNPGIPGCVFVAFESSSASNITYLGMEIQHFYGGGFYDYQPANFFIANNNGHDLYNTGGSPCAGDCIQGNGPGGLTYALNFWSNYAVVHNLCVNSAGFCFTFNSDQTSAAGHAFTETVDNNYIDNACSVKIDCGAVYTNYDPYLATARLGVIVHVTENYIKLNSPFGNTVVCIYADIGSSGVDARGNVCTGASFYAGVELDLGSNNNISNNIFDIPPQTGGGSFSVPYFWVWGASFAQCGGSCPPQINNTIGDNITYFNGAGGASPTWVGMYTTGGTLNPPTFPNTNWYATVVGSFPNGFQWTVAYNNTSSGVTDTNGTQVSASGLFANAGAKTVAGYQVVNSTVLTTFKNIPPRQGPR